MKLHAPITAWHEDGGTLAGPVIRDPDTDRAAVMKVCEDARDAADAAELLQALGLLPYEREHR